MKLMKKPANPEKSLYPILHVTNSLKEDDKVQLIGFGTFEVRERAAREGHNPHTGAKIQIPAAKVPAFKAGKALKDAIAE